jgi:hypothetical protein
MSGIQGKQKPLLFRNLRDVGAEARTVTEGFNAPSGSLLSGTFRGEIIDGLMAYMPDGIAVP